MSTITMPTSVFQETEPVTRLGPDSNGLRLTSEEFEAIEDAERGYRYELINGIVIVSPPVNAASRDPNGELGYLLRRYQEDHPHGHTLDLTLPENYIRVGQDWRIADRAIWCGLGTQPDPDEDVPTIAVEFVSASAGDRHRDYVEKRAQYLARGVKEYWIIDRFRRSLTVVFIDGTEKSFQEKANYTTPLLPGFELPVGRLMRLADKWMN